MYKVDNNMRRASREEKNIISFLASHGKGRNKLDVITTGIFDTRLSKEGLTSGSIKVALLLSSSSCDSW
jgi:hypothetical protein